MVVLAFGAVWGAGYEARSGSGLGQAERVPEFGFTLGHGSSQPHGEVPHRVTDALRRGVHPLADRLRGRLVPDLARFHHNEDGDAGAHGKPEDLAHGSALLPTRKAAVALDGAADAVGERRRLDQRPAER